MKKTKTILVSSLVLAFSFITIIGLVSAYKGDVNEVGPNYDPEVHSNIQEAIESKDYQSWRSLISSRNNKARVLEFINEDNFDEFSDAYTEAKNGNTQELTDFRESIGLGIGNQYRGQNLNKRNNTENRRFSNNCVQSI